MAVMLKIKHTGCKCCPDYAKKEQMRRKIRRTEKHNLRKEF